MPKLKRGLTLTRIIQSSPKFNQIFYTLVPNCLQNCSKQVPWIFCSKDFHLLKYLSLKRCLTPLWWIWQKRKWNFKTLACTVQKLCFASKVCNVKMPKSSKAIFFKIYSTVNQVIYASLQGCTFNSFFRYFADKISSIFFQRAIIGERGIILIRQKMCYLFCHMKSIHEILKF